MSDSAHALMLLIMLILPLSALVARRVSMGQTLKLAAVWGGIFAAAALLVTIVDRLRDGPAGEPATTRGKITRIARGADGHYWADGRINGVRRRMLIDSGATTTALSIETAKAAGIDIDESTFPRLIDTANGSVLARTAHIDRLMVGSIETDGLAVVVSEGLGDQDVIGMNFLSRLSSWRVEGDRMILLPPDPAT